MSPLLLILLTYLFGLLAMLRPHYLPHDRTFGLGNVGNVGNAGNVVIEARDRVVFDGTSKDGQFISGAFSTLQAGDKDSIGIHTAQ